MHPGQFSLSSVEQVSNRLAKPKAGNPRIAEHGKPYRFKPGNSGNPAGRARTKPLTEALRRILATDEDCDAVARAIVKFAKKGSVHHFREIADRLEGKAAQPVEHAGVVEHVITEAEKARALEVVALIQSYEAEEAHESEQRALKPAEEG